MNNQDLKDLIQKVTMYFDNELNDADERELLRQIKANPAYHKVFSQEKSFRELLKSRVYRRKPSPSLIRSIKEKIKISPAKPL